MRLATEVHKMSKHTPGPWSYWSGYNPFDKLKAQVTAEGGDIVIASYNSFIEQGEANACLMAAAPDMFAALVSVVENAQQRIFEDWLQRVSPSGDVDSVHAQWLDSGDYLEFTESWAEQLDAIDKARVKP